MGAQFIAPERPFLKILRGNANFTLDSLARVTRVLGSKMRFHIAPAESKKHGLPPSTVRFDPKARRLVVKPPRQVARTKAKG